MLGMEKINSNSMESEISSPGNLIWGGPKETESRLITRPNAASTLESRARLQLELVVHVYNPGIPAPRVHGYRSGVSVSSW